MNEVNKSVRSNSPLNIRDNDEIDILDLAFQLWKDKWIVISTVILFIILAVAYLFIAKEKWTSKAIVSAPTAGMVSNYNAVLGVLYSHSPKDKPALSDIQRQFFDRFFSSVGALSSELENQENPQKLTIEQFNKGVSDPLTISFTAESAKEAQSQLTKYIENVNENLIEIYSADLKRTLGVRTQEVKSIVETIEQVALEKKKQRIDAINQALKISQQSDVTKTPLSQAEYMSDDTLYLLGSDALTSMIQNEKTKPLSYTEDYYEARASLLALTHVNVDLTHLESFRYVSKADLPVRKDSPKKALILVIAVLLGGLFGCMIVILRNIFLNYQKQ